MAAVHPHLCALGITSCIVFPLRRSAAHNKFTDVASTLDLNSVQEHLHNVLERLQEPWLLFVDLAEQTLCPEK